MITKIQQNKSNAQRLSWSRRDENGNRIKFRPNCLDCGVGLKSLQNKSQKCKSCSHKNIPGSRGEKNGMWKGNKAKYTAIHMWMYSTFGQPETCENCGRDGLKGKKINWANISGEYHRNRVDWIRLCKPCHTAFDDIINRGWITKKARVASF